MSITTSVFGQKTETLSILKADTTWGKEIIKFPVAWAPKVKYKGFEELRFSPGWKHPESDQFWSYVLAWNVQTDRALTAVEIAANLEYYFDGLMKPNHWAQSFPEPVVVLIKENENGNTTEFKGKMKFFDGFHTGKMITKNILAQQLFCETTGKTIIACRMSIKDFEHTVWKDLDEVKLKQDVCE